MRRVRFVGVAMVLIALTAAPSAAARSWQIQPSANGTGAKASRLVAVSCTSAPACTAVGNYINSTGIQVTLAERSNGANWSVQTTPPVVGAKSSELSGVACTSATSCTAVGSYTNGTGTRLTLAEHWNGTSWAIQTTP